MKELIVRNIFIVSILLTISMTSSHVSYGQDIKGKVIIGYQGWFSTPGSESPDQKWTHWYKNTTTPPRVGELHFEMYPDMREYTNTYNTGFAKLGNGQTATLFSSYDTQTVTKHAEWLQKYGIDVVALQRFGNELTGGSKQSHRDGIATKIKNASVKYRRKFFIMYDLSGWGSYEAKIKADWLNVIQGDLNLLNSSAYAKEDGKPVVCIWGPGTPKDTDPDRDNRDPAVHKRVVDWFKSQGCYVILGVDKAWQYKMDEHPDLEPAFLASDMIAPWHVGTLSMSGVNNFGGKIAADMAYCVQNGLDYMPGAWPGFARENKDPGTGENRYPRHHGNFMWAQFHKIKEKFDQYPSLTPTVYAAMFDEVDEGTAIFKCAEDASMIPTDQYFLTLDRDGVHCSSDFYLRLTGNGARMVKGEIELTTDHLKSTPHTFTLGLESLSEQQAVNIYPNPLKGNLLTVDLNGFKNSEPIIITITSMIGQLVYSHTIKNSEHLVIDKSGLLKQGIYLLTVKSGQSMLTKKIIVE